MYNPSHFKTDDPASLHDLIQAHPLGCLVTHSDSGLDANHLPFELLQDEDGVLRLIAHVARANPVWQQIRDDSSVLVIFRAEQAYISPNWYPSKHENHEQVPTWNYRVVHAHGRIGVRDDEKFVRGVVGRLTRRHEARNNAQAPWKMSDAPPDYLQRMLGAIVGLEITVDRLEAKFKLSQNKQQRDRLGAVQALEQLGQLDLALSMRLP
ncbi:MULTISPECIES: FMN-binding negative transcriptional regulator [Comamonas]|uniref:FMN-binding negative transcriptional regulator n=1 Tax=Comamonas TaxID=283 RepID=UPI0005100E60|nr:MULTISPECIES: FMN-binding negative transcriptional regulator [Comamonas]KGG84006.1 transcriptional regulator [Comamonas thiooxydans]KGG88719.1 transcriptional regulator [Comamonas thiooxydans]KGG94217.1 transcriptional regulator [Comamonas thiooxydans]KGG99653.1 transcriptional regulator [Comamonas thiooxydans]KGH04853.1 transcriptional regulator [Comamonas thiooxydans]